MDADAVCYMYHTLKDGVLQESLLPSSVIDGTKTNCTVPTVGLFDFSLKDGIERDPDAG